MLTNPIFHRARACVISTSLLLLATAAGGQSSEMADSADAADADRAQRLEARLTQLEALLRSSGLLGDELPAAPEGADAWTDVEQRLAALEELVHARLIPPAVVKSAPAPAPTLAADPAPETEVASEEQESPMDKWRYLPSLGYAGGALHYGESDQRLQLHAFLELEYVDAGPDGSRSGVSTFDNHHANVFVRSQLGPSLLGHIELEFEHGGETVEVDQAYLEWATSDWLSVRAGRFYTPFGIERFVWYSPTNALVSRPEPMRQIIPGSFYANGIEVLGVVEARSDDRFTYEIGLTDGLGDDALNNRRGSRQTRDNNSSRALSGRLGYAFGAQTEIGASYHQQRYSTEGDLDLRFLGLDLSSRWNGWEFRSEWVDASFDQPIFDDTGLALQQRDLEQLGWYAQLAYSFDMTGPLQEMRLVSRYDSVDFDRSVTGNDDQKLWSLGVNLLLLDHLRTKFEYRFISEDGPSRDDDTFYFQMVLDF